MSLNGYLGNYITGVVAKRLAEGEINPSVSNQHEFNATSAFLSVFGREKRLIKTIFYYLCDQQEENLSCHGELTLYDARERTPDRTEFRVYYKSNEVIERANTDDLLILALKRDLSTVCLIIPRGSAIENQLMWLFRLSEVGRKFQYNQYRMGDEQSIKLGFSALYILDELGIELNFDGVNKELDLLVENFNDQFPSTKVFSDYSRKRVEGLNDMTSPDEILMACMSKEEELFRIFEKHLVKDQIKEGFGVEEEMVEYFIKFSLSVQNRRKSRAGYAFQNHLEFVFKQKGVSYSAQKRTEGNKTPDFLFPGVENYFDNSFPSDKLFMLGVKTSCKERWSQINSEAERISLKHLATLEPAMPRSQTNEIRRNNIQLVIPTEIQETYSVDQRRELISLEEFLEIVSI